MPAKTTSAPTLIATSASYPLARNWPLSSGTFFTEEDDESYAGVAVLGKTAAENLFPATPARWASS